MQTSMNITVNAKEYVWLFGVGTDHRIYKQKLEVGLSTTTPWLDAGAGDMISITIARDTIYGVGADNQIYKQKTSTMSSTSEWEKAGNGDMISIAIDIPWDTIYGLGTDGHIYKQFLSAMSPDSSWTWARPVVKVPPTIGTWSSIAIDDSDDLEAGNDMIYAVGKDNQIYYQTLRDFNYGYDWYNASQGRSSDEMISISMLEKTGYPHIRMFGVGFNKKVYFQNADRDQHGRLGDWIELAKGDMISVACGWVLYPDDDDDV